MPAIGHSEDSVRRALGSLLDCEFSLAESRQKKSSFLRLKHIKTGAVVLESEFKTVLV